MVNVVAGTEEDITIVSRQEVKINWAGTLTMASGSLSGEPTALSGFIYESGETQVQITDGSGRGQIRIPELNVVNKLLVKPKKADINATVAYISGNVAAVQYAVSFISGPVGTWSGLWFCSGLVDVFAWGR